jgi:hypothetical protein
MISWVGRLSDTAKISDTSDESAIEFKIRNETRTSRLGAQYTFMSKTLSKLLLGNEYTTHVLTQSGVWRVSVQQAPVGFIASTDRQPKNPVLFEREREGGGCLSAEMTKSDVSVSQVRASILLHFSGSRRR